MLIQKKYIILPYNNRMTLKHLEFYDGDDLIFDFRIKLDFFTCECLAYINVEPYIGRDISIRFFASEEDVPRQAYTMGIKTIMQANKILMVASGEDKAEIVKRAFFGPITPEVPASVLQLHNDVTLVGDEAALSLIGSCQS